MRSTALPWLLCAILVGFLVFVLWKAQQVAVEYQVIKGSMDRAVQVGLVTIKPQTGDTIYMNTKLKYVLTGESRLYGGN